MATRSNIIAKLEDGKYYGIYCHYDGYPEGVGKKLLENYNNLPAIRKLIALGDIRCLEAELENCEQLEPAGFEPSSGMSYENVDFMFCHDFHYEDYTYIFEDGNWTFFSWDNSHIRVDLKNHLGYNDSSNSKNTETKKETKMKLDIRTVTRKQVFQATTENIYDVATDCPEDDACMISMAQDMIAAVLMEEPDLLREMLEDGNAPLMLPTDLMDELWSTDEAPVNMIIVIVEDDGTPWLTINVKDIEV